MKVKWAAVLAVLAPCQGFVPDRRLPSSLLTGFKPLVAPTSSCLAQLPSHTQDAAVDDERAPPSVDDDDSTEALVALGRREFADLFRFPLDDWQLHAGGAIHQGYNVVVCAPTGAGKTVIGEMALQHAFLAMQNGIYTTPLKALSNQKYSELGETFGRSNIGLSTGDISLNKGARITVMTTEVYRNIAWRSSTPSASVMGTDELLANAVVVLDEFHYMGYPGRGGVWEESIITSPPHTQIIGLSATLSNGPEIAAWMESVTGRKTCLVNVPNENRPVPLRYLFATKEGLFPLFRDPDAGPGSPHGLLGYRGEGKALPSLYKSKRHKNGFDSDDGKLASDKIPKGLQVNPALRAAAERRLQKVNRTLDRKRAYSAFGSPDDRWGGGGSRSRPVGQKARKLSPREERREKERLLKNEMRRAVPSMAALVRRLDQKKLLPAIVFIFSRAGCDGAARNVYEAMKGPRDPNRLLEEEFAQFGIENPRPKQKKKKARKRGRRQGELVEDGDGRTFRPGSNYIDDDVLASLMEDDSVSPLENDAFDETSPLSPENWDYYAKAGLLDAKQVRDVACRISLFNDRNPEIEFDDDIIEQYLFGVGSHHAGMLPAHKSFVEVLYRNQLMKVVFATETLAAGINMPARTTVVCALAKRGDGSSMNLLETSNLLQMAGRAGRRGYDTEGTCVIVATPFESHEDASKILTDPIKPIQSQFSPSYSLSVNLIARGEGRLVVARQLVSKSFAMWEKRQVENRINSAIESVDGVGEVMIASSQERFMKTLQETLQLQVNRRQAKFDISRIQALLDTLCDKEYLKKTSKSFLSLTKMLDIEDSTFGYLSSELDAMNVDATDAGEDVFTELVSEDRTALLEQIDAQLERVTTLKKDIRRHPFSTIASITNEIITEDTPEGVILLDALQSARQGSELSGSVALSAAELSGFAKSAVVIGRKTRKLANANPDLDPLSLLEQADRTEVDKDGSWDDMLAIIKTLVAYGCVQMEDVPDENVSMEEAFYTVTPAGMNIGMLGFENSLWTLVAMGGAWDVAGASANLDKFRKAMDAFDSDDEWYDDDEADQAVSLGASADEQVPKSQEEADTLLSLIISLSPAELAGYAAAIVSESSRGGSGTSVVEIFQQVTPLQQRVIQSSLLSLERLVEVQKSFGVDEGTRQCNLDIANVQVVTAWADGCSWSEALRLSGGAPPGDLARTLSRVLDAVRQLGNLPFTPIRKDDRRGKMPRGIHPDVRDLCRDAARAINRYPVKDPFSFEADQGDEPMGTEEENQEEEEEEEPVQVVSAKKVTDETDVS